MLKSQVQYKDWSRHITNNDLKKHLSQYRYYHPPNKKEHQDYGNTNKKPISFILIVDNLDKYTNEGNINYLIEAIKTKYSLQIDQTESKYIGISFEKRSKVINERIYKKSNRTI